MKYTHYIHKMNEWKRSIKDSLNGAMYHIRSPLKLCTNTKVDKYTWQFPKVKSLFSGIITAHKWCPINNTSTLFFCFIIIIIISPPATHRCIMYDYPAGSLSISWGNTVARKQRQANFSRSLFQMLFPATLNCFVNTWFINLANRNGN